MMERPRFLKVAGMAAVLGLAGAFVPVHTEQASAGGRCPSETKGLPIAAGETKTFNARRAIVTGDVFVNGVRKYDDRSDTGAVNFINSSACKTWTIGTDYGASVVIEGDSLSQKTVLATESRAINQMASDRGAADVYVNK